MAIRRRLPPPSVYGSSKRSLGAMPIRTPLYNTGVSRASSVAYDTRVEDYLLGDRISDASYLSAYTLDDTDNTVRRSRGRDAQLLRDATSAIVSSESYATPQSSVAARRVARGRSVPARAASVPPKSLYPEVDSVEIKRASTTIRQPLARSRPIVIYARPSGEDRALSVPPTVLFAREERRQRVQASVPREDWRSRAYRAQSVPPRVYRSPSPPARRRLYYRGAAARAAYARPTQESQREPLPTAGLRAHKVPRRFLTRSGMRTGFSGLLGYYDHNRKDSERPRVLASPLARAKARGYLYGAYGYFNVPKPKPAPIQQSLSNFPQVYVPTKGRKPSNRSKAAIIASKMEPDPLKRRRPRSEFAANKYRALKREAQESIYSGTPSSSGLYAHNPSLRT